ncbi:MAG: hypothetical protein ACD_19C00016G0013 [uncultured bacterium]|nr:MAG: hypothetical protein ACD_19C00016G0013 [uncultured bacterium]
MNRLHFKSINPEFDKLPLKKLFILSFLISIITVFLGIGAQFFLPPKIPLYYGLPQTEDQLASSFFIILPAFISIVLTLINLLLSLKTHGYYFGKVLAFTSISISFLSAITTYKIIFLVGSL